MDKTELQEPQVLLEQMVEWADGQDGQQPTGATGPQGSGLNTLTNVTQVLRSKLSQWGHYKNRTRYKSR